MMLCGAIVGTILVSLKPAAPSRAQKLSLGAFPSSVHHQHIQIEKLTETFRIVFRHNHIHQQHTASPGHGWRQFLRMMAT
jgi:hypothetical protein